MANQMSAEEIQRQLGCNVKQWKKLCAEARAQLRDIPPSQNQNTSIQWEAYAENWLSSRDRRMPNRTVGEVMFEDSIGSQRWPQDQRKIMELVAQTFQYNSRQSETPYDENLWIDSNSMAIDQGMPKAPTASMIMDPTPQQAKEVPSLKKQIMAKRSRDTEDLISKSKKLRAKASSSGADQASNNTPEGESRKCQNTNVSSSVPEDPGVNLPLREVSNSEAQNKGHHHPQSIENPVLVQSPVTDPATREKSETIFVQSPFTATTAAAIDEPMSAQDNSIKERFQAVPTVSPPSPEKTQRNTSNIANTSRPQQVPPVAVSPLPRAQATAMNSRRLRTKIIFRAYDKSLGYFKDSDMRFESIDAFFEAIARQINARERINRLMFYFEDNSFKNVCVDKEDPDAHLDFQDILELAKRYELEQSSDHLNIGLSFL